MSGERLKEERLRLRYSQTEFSELAGVSRGAQINYEKGDRSPDTAYLSTIAKMGVDILYVITGARKQPQIEALEPEEKVLLGAYRKLPEAEQKHLMVLALTGVDIKEDKKAKKNKGTTVSIGNENIGTVAAGNIKIRK